MMPGLSSKEPFSNLQLELLKLFAAGVQDKYLEEIKEMIARYLLAKAREESGIIWQEKGYTAETTNEWLSSN